MDSSFQTPPPTLPQAADRPRPFGSYRRLHRLVLLSTIVVSVAPLLLLTAANYLQYDRAVRNEAENAVQALTSNTRRAIEFFLKERLAELTYISYDNSIDELRSDSKLARILDNMNQSMPQRAFVDLGLIDSQGNQLSYVGPYELHGRMYAEQEWFREVHRQGVYISDVFLGYRQSPHFVVAVSHGGVQSGTHIVRATIDTQMLDRQIASYGVSQSNDCFVVNQDGVLQTPSRRYGDVLDRCPLTLPPTAHETLVLDWRDENGKRVVLGYASIERSPFRLIMLSVPGDVTGDWLAVRVKLLSFLAFSVLVILAAAFWGSNALVKRLRRADADRLQLLHNIEYTNKLASLGRLAAGTAHEINNPLAVINENAGLLQDLFALKQGKAPPAEKIAKLTDSIQRGVDRCSSITHRLLGFAKHMDVRFEPLDLRALIEDVMEFHNKETGHRDLHVEIRADDDVPVIESDRGQLQQVFLNLINNAFAAVSDGGSILVTIERHGDESIAVSVADDGVGISRENLSRVFEPFFSTKGDHGTGLGLSVTYGIVERLGGGISVESDRGRGTTFTVSLPIKPSK